jgi:hypothetical protein
MRRAHLTEILLPMFDQGGKRFPTAPYGTVRVALSTSSAA